MLRILKNAAKKVLGAARRFLANQPANEYEEVIFSAIRNITVTYGKAAFV